MLSLVVFPSVIVVMGALAVLYGLSRHHRYMESIRQQRARDLTAKRTSASFAWASEIVLTNVVAVEGALLMGYERLDVSGRTPRDGTIVAYCADSAAVRVLETWASARVGIEAAMDLSGRRLVLRQITNSERVELSTIPVGSAN